MHNPPTRSDHRPHRLAVVPPREDPRAGLPPRRALLVAAGSVAAAMTVWLVARLLGVEVLADKGAEPAPVTSLDVVVAAVVAMLCAWGVSTLLARRGLVNWWPFTGSTLIALSMLGPAYQVDGASAMTLMLLHLVVGGVVTVGFTQRPAWVPGNRRPTP